MIEWFVHIHVLTLLVSFNILVEGLLLACVELIHLVIFYFETFESFILLVAVYFNFHFTTDFHSVLFNVVSYLVMQFLLLFSDRYITYCFYQMYCSLSLNIDCHLVLKIRIIFFLLVKKIRIISYLYKLYYF